ncbi:MAG: hypothetical protein IJ379_02670 [Lachnospiraceae bacterium]|nr:hypothetical protein [Lachnospiraceae bacterium]
MNRRKRLGDTEINLTPLLDVLFTILFIVMLGSAQNERETQAQAEQEAALLQQQNEVLQQQTQGLQQEVTQLEQQLGSYDIHKEQAIVITMRNVVEEDVRKLKLAREVQVGQDIDILLGTDRLNYAANRIQSYVTELVDAHTGQPVYIVFYCDKTQIYTVEYNTIREELDELQNSHKEVFYKVVEGE